MTDLRKDALLKEYGEIGQNFRLLTEIRFKLLGLIPIAALTSVLFTKNEPYGGTGFIVSLFGLAITCFLASYNARNDQLYDELVGRAASIERSLGVPDGYFANRPRAWFKVHCGQHKWPVEHGYAVAGIYASSCALWLVGVLAPIIEMLRRIYLVFGYPYIVTSQPQLYVNLLALGIAIVLTFLALRILYCQNEDRERDLRQRAVFAVRAMFGRRVNDLPLEPEFREAMKVLAGKEFQTIQARAEFYGKLAPKSICHYVLHGSQEVEAAHAVAVLTDLPARWLFDCATDRRGVSKEEVKARGQWLTWLMALFSPRKTNSPT